MVPTRLNDLHGGLRLAPVPCAAVTRARPRRLDKALHRDLWARLSLGAFMPLVIKAKKLADCKANVALDIAFQERTPDAYTAQFNSGREFEGRAAARRCSRSGSPTAAACKVKYLFNLFDFWGAVVTSRPEIKTLKDLEGKQLAGARATTNYVMFEFFAKKLGVDVSKIQVVNTATPGLVGLCARQPRRCGADLGAGLHAACSPRSRTSARSTCGIEKTWKAVRRRRQPHPLSRRRRACRLGRAEPGAGGEALRHLQGGGGMDREESRRGGATARAGRRRPRTSSRDGLARPQQRAAGHEPPFRRTTSARRSRRSYKAGIDVGYFLEHAVERDGLRQADPMNDNPAPDPAAAGHRQHAGR